MDEPSTFAASGNQDTNNTTAVHLPPAASKKPCTSTANTPKGKMRAAFSESQMSALVQRFSVQRYLTPAEMKNLAEMTGLTYKQVSYLTMLFGPQQRFVYAFAPSEISHLLGQDVVSEPKNEA